MQNNTSIKSDEHQCQRRKKGRNDKEKKKKKESGKDDCRNIRLRINIRAINIGVPYDNEDLKETIHVTRFPIVPSTQVHAIHVDKK